MIELKSDITSFISAAFNDNENALKPSYRVSFRVAKAAKKKFIA
jgi:hypothetical protein